MSPWILCGGLCWNHLPLCIGRWCNWRVGLSMCAATIFQDRSPMVIPSMGTLAGTISRRCGLCRRTRAGYVPRTPSSPGHGFPPVVGIWGGGECANPEVRIEQFPLPLGERNSCLSAQVSKTTISRRDGAIMPGEWWTWWRDVWEWSPTSVSIPSTIRQIRHSREYSRKHATSLERCFPSKSSRE